MAPEMAWPSFVMGSLRPRHKGAVVLLVEEGTGREVDAYRHCRRCFAWDAKVPRGTYIVRGGIVAGCHFDDEWKGAGAEVECLRGLLRGRSGNAKTSRRQPLARQADLDIHPRQRRQCSKS